MTYSVVRTFIHSAIFVFAYLATFQSTGWAQTAMQNIQLNAKVEDYCTTGGFATDASRSRITRVNGGVVETLAQVSIANVACSRISDLTLTVTNDGLAVSGARAGFQNVTRYVAIAWFDGAAPALVTGASNFAIASTTSAATGRLTVNITRAANGPLRVTGSYSDILVVTLNPKL